MTLTGDNKLICSHGWDEETAKYTKIVYTADEAPNYEEFMSWKICGKYKAIDAAVIVEYMRSIRTFIEIDQKSQSRKNKGNDRAAAGAGR